MERRYSNPSSIGANYDDLFKDRKTPSQDRPIPKIAHFVYSTGREITWLEWLAVRAAIVNLGAEKVKIWLPEQAQMEGDIWKRVEAMEKVSLCRIAMPESVYDHDIPEPHRADVARLKILYEEGGIYLETDLIALKSSDDILNSPSTRSTIMARRLSPAGIPNWLIMTKPGSPFLKRWMLMYKGAWDQGDWKKLALQVPEALADDLDEDLTILDGYSWFYPLASEEDGDATLKRLWFGKSWDDIGKSYGTHVWHWSEDFRHLVTPEVVRTIDTPLFCSLRHLFDDLDRDGYNSTELEENANCSITTVEKLKEKNHRIFADYRMDSDDVDTKWVDSSGYNLHGWAPEGTSLVHGDGPTYRKLAAHAYAILPVPSGWDSRVWTARMDLHLDARTLNQADYVGLFKIRTEADGEIVVRAGQRGADGLVLDLEWREGGPIEVSDYMSGTKNKNERWIPVPGLQVLEKAWHELAVTFDRRELGMLHLFLDGAELGSQELPILDKANWGQDIWINAIDWDEMDFGFRGKLRRFTVYADALSVKEIAQDIPSASTIQSASLLVKVPVTKSQGMSLFGVMALMVVLLLMVRGRKTLIRDVASYTREGIRKARQISGSHAVKV